MGGNSDAMRERIADLRKKRTAALSKANRAYERALEARHYHDREQDKARLLAKQIEELGGKVRR